MDLDDILAYGRQEQLKELRRLRLDIATKVLPVAAGKTIDDSIELAFEMADKMIAYADSSTAKLTKDQE